MYDLYSPAPILEEDPEEEKLQPPPPPPPEPPPPPPEGFVLDQPEPPKPPEEVSPPPEGFVLDQPQAAQPEPPKPKEEGFEAVKPRGPFAEDVKPEEEFTPPPPPPGFELDQKRDVGVGESISRGLTRGLHGLSEMLSDSRRAFRSRGGRTGQGRSPGHRHRQGANAADSGDGVDIVKGQRGGEESPCDRPPDGNAGLLGRDGTGGGGNSPRHYPSRRGAGSFCDPCRGWAQRSGACDQDRGELAPTVWNTIRRPRSQYPAGGDFLCPPCRPVGRGCGARSC